MPLKRTGAWGRNNYYQLGDGTTNDRSSPVEVTVISGVKEFALGGYHSLALKEDGTVWAWGLNSSGQLGDGTTTDRSTPVQVSGLSNVVAVAAGYGHSLALKDDGTVWAWGLNNSGQLGDGTTTNRLAPVQVLGLADITRISAGSAHSLARRSDGTAWAWGENGTGPLGDGTTTDRPGPVQVTGLSSVTSVAAGGRHSLFLLSDQTVFAVGYNAHGQLGDGTTTDRTTPVQVSALTDVVAIAAGHHAAVYGYGTGWSLAVRSDGTVWAWGWNAHGQLGDGTQTSRLTPVQTQGLTNIASVAAGGLGAALGDYYGHSLALGQDGRVWGWGDNRYGQVGDGTTQTRLTPVQASNLSGIVNLVAGGDHSLAVDPARALIFVGPAGYRIPAKDFGSVIAGNTLGPTGVDLYNGSGLTVQQPQVTVANAPPGEVIEISKTSDPFVADDPLVFSGTFQPEALIGTVYVRMQPPITSEGTKTFQLKATATPA